MQLFKSQLMRFLRSGDIIDRHGIRVRVLGRLELLNDDIKEIIDIMVKKTAYNKGPILNLCFAYTSRDEIARAIEKTVREHRGQTAGNTITQQTLASNMDISDDYPVDILIRTSGVGRLSDFLLWQCHRDTYIQILDKQWPSFQDLDLFWIILGWQRRERSITTKYQARRTRGLQPEWSYASRSYCKFVMSIIAFIVPVAWGYQLSFHTGKL